MADQGNVTLKFQIAKHLLRMFVTGAMIGLLLVAIWWAFTKLLSRYSPIAPYGAKKDLVKIPVVCVICLLVYEFLKSNWLAEHWAWLSELWAE